MEIFELVPTEIRVNKAKNELKIAFDNKQEFNFTAEFLRVTSPSAEVQGHHPSQAKTVPGKKNVKIAAIEPVGNYAIKIDFDDGHDTGIFSWSHLHLVGTRHEELWNSYLDKLTEKGLSR